MSAAHTEGLLVVAPGSYGTSKLVLQLDQHLALAAHMREPDARRLAACWNACEGISTENLEDNQTVKVLADQYNVARALLSEVLAKVEPETDAQDELFPRIRAFLKGGGA